MNLQINVKLDKKISKISRYFWKSLSIHGRLGTALIGTDIDMYFAKYHSRYCAASLKKSLYGTFFWSFKQTVLNHVYITKLKKALKSDRRINVRYDYHVENVQILF